MILYIISTYYDYDKCPEKMNFWVIGQYASMVVSRVMVWGTLHQNPIGMFAYFGLCLQTIFIMIWIPQGLLWFSIIVFTKPNCTGSVNQFIMGTLVLSINCFVSAGCCFMFSLQANSITNTVRVNEVRMHLNEEFYNNQLSDPNFSLDVWISEHQGTLDELEFTNIELTLLQEKFTHKYKNQHNSSYDEELAKMHENFKSCSICMFDFQNEDLCVDLPGCKHPHHFQCIKPWLEKKPSCPVCRSNIRLGMIRELHNKPNEQNINKDDDEKIIENLDKIDENTTKQV